MTKDHVAPDGGQRPDEEARREHWTSAMEAAHEFMDLMREYPVEECGESMASIRDAASAATAIQDPQKPLHSMEQIRECIEAALERVRESGAI